MADTKDRFKEKDLGAPISKGGPKKSRKQSNAKKPYRSRNQARYNVADKKERFDAAADANVWKSDGNDPKWYNQFPDQVRNFASFNFRAPVGSQVRLTDTAAGAPLNADRYPGVMALYFCPSAGSKEEGNASMLNLAATRLYQFTRFENNGSSKYDRGDLMLYFLAMDSCYMFHAWMKRIYSEMHQFSNMNRYLPRALMRAERVDYEDLEKKLPKFRGWINQYAEKLSVLPIPHSMSYMARHSWMANSLFVDTDTVKCQFYLYVPQYFQRFAVADGTGTLPAGTPWLQLDDPTYGNNRLTLDDLINYGNSLIDPLIDNEDFNLIGADVLKAFGSNGVVVLDEIPDDYTVLPMYSEEVLNQIENSTAIGHPACYGSLILPAQNNGASVYWDGSTNKLIPNDEVWLPFDVSQTYQLNPIPYQLNRIINFESDSITNDDIMVATRLAQILEPPTTVTGSDQMTYSKCQCKTLGSEFITQFTMFFFTNADTGEWRIGNTVLGYYGYPVISSIPHGDQNTAPADWVANTTAAKSRLVVNTTNFTRFSMNLAQFNRHPRIMMYGLQEFIDVGPDGQPRYRGHNWQGFYYTAKNVGDTANFAVFEKGDLIDLSTVALQSEFFVPLTASGAVKVTAI